MVWVKVLYGVLTQRSAGTIPVMNISVWFPEWNWPLVHTKIQTQGQPQNCYLNVFTTAQVFSMQSTLGTCQWFDSLCPVYLNFLILQSNNCCQEDKCFLTVMTRQTLGKQTRIMSSYCKMPVQSGPLPCCQAPHCACTLLVCPQTTSGSKLQGADFFLGGKIWGKRWPTGYTLILI